MRPLLKVNTSATGNIPGRTFGQAAVGMVDDDDVVSLPGSGRLGYEFGPQ